MADDNTTTDAALLNEHTCAEIEHWLAKYPEDQRRSALLPALSAAQHQHGWLSREVMDAVADYLGLDRIAVYEVASFYSMYHLHPVGRHEIAVCTNITCSVRGSDQVVAHLEGKLGCKLGETSPDGKVTLKIEEECLAACAGAPMMAVDGHYYEHLTPEAIDTILDNLE